MLKLKLQYFGHLMRRVDSLEKILMLGGIGGGKGDDRRWDGWMASLIQWTWVWVNSRRWWWTGRPGMLRFMGSQRVGHDWATELNWTELNPFIIHRSFRSQEHPILEKRSPPLLSEAWGLTTVFEWVLGEEKYSHRLKLTVFPIFYTRYHSLPLQALEQQRALPRTSLDSVPFLQVKNLCILGQDYY